MRYYCTGEVLENGYLKCVVPKISPTENGILPDLWLDKSSLDAYISSLPLAALVVGGKTGWLDEKDYEKRYEVYNGHWTNDEWRKSSKFEYEGHMPSARRIVLIPKQEIKEEIKDRQCKKETCSAEKPFEYENEIMAGGVLCGGCGRTKPNVKYVLADQQGNKEKPEEKSEDICSCGVPVSLHNTCCGWGNANLIVFPWEKTISFGPDDAKKRYEISKLPSEQQETAFKQHFGNIISTPPVVEDRPADGEKQRLIDYIYDFAWHWGRFYHLDDADKIKAAISERLKLPEEFLNNFK